MALLCKYVPPTLEDYDWNPKTQMATLTYPDRVETHEQGIAKHTCLGYKALKAKYYADLALWIKAEHGRSLLSQQFETKHGV